MDSSKNNNRITYDHNCYIMKQLSEYEERHLHEDLMKCKVLKVGKPLHSLRMVDLPAMTSIIRENSNLQEAISIQRVKLSSVTNMLNRIEQLTVLS